MDNISLPRARLFRRAVFAAVIFGSKLRDYNSIFPFVEARIHRSAFMILMDATVSFTSCVRMIEAPLRMDAI